MIFRVLEQRFARMESTSEVRGPKANLRRSGARECWIRAVISV